MFQKHLFWCHRPLWGAVALLFVACPLAAQSRIEVASVRENLASEDAVERAFEFQPGRLTIGGMTIENMVAFAYGIDSLLRDRLIVGWPKGGLNDKRFDITANLTSKETLTVEQRRLVVRVLASRFGFKAHSEPRTLDVYHLKLAKPAGALAPGLRRVGSPGCELKEGRPACLPASRYEPKRIRGTGEIAQLIEFLEIVMAGTDPGGPSIRDTRRPFVGRGRLIVDATGLKGSFVWDYARDAPERDLGLRLERGRAVVPVVVIDAVQMPTPN